VAKFTAEWRVIPGHGRDDVPFQLRRVLAMFGEPDWGPVYCGYVALLLLARGLVVDRLAISAFTATRSWPPCVARPVRLLWGIDPLEAAAPHPLEMGDRRRCWRASRPSHRRASIPPPSPSLTVTLARPVLPVRSPGAALEVTRLIQQEPR